MTPETTTAPVIQTVEQLASAGFTPEQIERLEAARAAYNPLIELVESNRELRRLQFLRWLYRRGNYPQG